MSKTKILLALFLAAAGVVAFSILPEHSVGAENLVTETVTRGVLSETVKAIGILEPSTIVQVGAQVTGQLKAIHAALGSEVKAGDLIAEIDSLQQQNELRLANASLSEARATARSREAQVKKTERTLARQRELYKGQAGTGADLQDAEAAAEIAHAEADISVSLIEKATVEVEKAQTNLGYTRIGAPIDGRILALVAKPGQTLNAAQTTPVIAVVARTDVMTSRVAVSEADIGRIKVGQTVRFTTYGDRANMRETVLREVEPAPPSILTTNAQGQDLQAAGTPAQAVYYNVLFDAPNDDGALMPMMTTEVTIVVKSVDNTLLTPWPSLTGPDRSGRYSAKVRTANGRLDDRQVTIGLTDRIKAEVLTGLSEGEDVVLSTAVTPAEAAR